MNRPSSWKPAAVCAALLALLAACGSSSSESGLQSIPLAELHDRIEGGWAGQMIGVSYGLPTEFKFNNQIIPEADVPVWTPDRVAEALDNDDLYVDMTFAAVLDEKGLDATTEDFGAMFKEADYRLWHANLAARRALRRGVPATLTGTPKYNAHANDIDFQIEADFIGLMAPGLPQAANDICWRAGRVMNYGDGIYGGMFVSGMYAAAFFESDPEKVVRAGLASIPAESPYAQVIADTIAWSKESPDDWMKVWQRLEDKWNGREACPKGAVEPFNIDAKLNGAYIALGLLYGRGDFEKTMVVAMRAGQDSDCNPASAGGILGVMLGYQAIPEKWKSGIPPRSDEKFSYTNFTFKTIVESTQKRAIALVERNGGRLEGDRLLIRKQEPQAPKLEVWDDYGSPVEQISVEKSAWKFQGDWQPTEAKQRENVYIGRKSGTKGAEAEVSFQGTGAIVSGPLMAKGGMADIYLDGEPAGSTDVYSDADNYRHSESVWHVFGLPDGEHTIRLVVRGEAPPHGQGTDVTLENLIVFR
ncbi:MAG: ADP-ribosylglycohydrolase family protein [Acidobacteria bacterium]|nr:ADP-ribosylglycohydrolase family protein [Acidobacteriota bacterium]